MRAVVYHGANDLRLEQVPVPRIQPNEVLVKVGVCGVCPTDIKKIHYGTVPPPRVFGHETAGTIAVRARRCGVPQSANAWRCITMCPASSAMPAATRLSRNAPSTSGRASRRALNPPAAATPSTCA